mgnify:CR=1 FL=1|tara:strand:- start:3308 stop:4006 length:699 start_codon:yes stop_codon:yes gene_type:complete
MSILSSVVCTIGIFSSFCLSKPYKQISLDTFETDIMSTDPEDGSKIVISRHNISFKNAGGLPIFQVDDTDLVHYLGPQYISVIELKDNVTDFDMWTWDGHIDPNGIIDMDSVLSEATRKEFKQSGQMNVKLQLIEKQNIFEDDLHIVVFFKNETEAMEISHLVNNIDADISKSCWNVFSSDPPSSVRKIPSVGITSRNVFGYEHVSILSVPISEYSLNAFVNANIKELKMKT